MSEEYEQFISKCEQEGIFLYRGALFTESRPHIHIEDSNDFVKYCIQNEIKAILIEPILVEQVEVDLDSINEKITEYYYTILNAPRSPKYPNITSDEYDQVLNRVLNQIKDDPLVTDTIQRNHEIEQLPEEEITETIWCFVFHFGTMVSTYFDFDLDESLYESEYAEETIISKYKSILSADIRELYQVAEERIAEKRDGVFYEIAEIVRNNEALKEMYEQKTRNRYADSLYAIHYKGKVPRPIIRSIVDMIYNDICKGK